MEGGASGFLLKDAPASELAAAIRRAMAGERIVDPGLAAAALCPGRAPLTPREHEVLAASRQHATVAELARRAVPVSGHGAQPPVLGDAEARRPQPRARRCAGPRRTAGCRRARRRDIARADAGETVARSCG